MSIKVRESLNDLEVGFRLRIRSGRPADIKISKEININDKSLPRVANRIMVIILLKMNYSFLVANIEDGRIFWGLSSTREFVAET
jgi:hypothetical protein